MPRKERVIYHQLRDQGFDVYYPYLVARTSSPNMLKIEPYFPGYIFVRVDADKTALNAFKWLPMVEGLVCVAGLPAFIPDRILHAIHRKLWRVNSQMLGTPDRSTETEQPLTEDVNFAGDGSLFDQNLSGTERVNALFDLLQGLSLATD